MSTQPPENDGPRDLAEIATGLSDDVKGVRKDLAGIKKWRRRFVLAAAVAAVLFVIAGAVGAIAIEGNRDSNRRLQDTQAHLAAVVACNNAKSRALVDAVQERAAISTEQQHALAGLFGQVLHVTSSAAFTADINAYNATAARLAAHPVPPYPANACR